MRSTRGLLIVLIGMISMTVFATTSEPVHKSKPTTEYVAPSAASFYVANVAPAAVQIVATIYGSAVISSEAGFYVTGNESLTIKPIDDVGWQNDSIPFDKCKVMVYDLHGNPLYQDYEQVPRGMYIVVWISEKVRHELLVFKE